MPNAVKLVGSLKDFVAGLRVQFDSFETTTKQMTPRVSQQYKSEKHCELKCKKQQNESRELDCKLSGLEKSCVELFNVIIDKSVAELHCRCKAYKGVCGNFRCMNYLHLLSASELDDSAVKLQNKYSTNLQEDFANELVQFREFTKHEENKIAKTLLLNVDIALWIFLTLPVTNTGGEQLFSKLALIKNKLRSRMDQMRLNNLTLMSIEYDLLHQLDFSYIIEDFSAPKTRKKLI